MRAVRRIEPAAVGAILAGSPALLAAKRGLGEEAAGAWAVGGAVRDALAGLDPTDIDLAYAGDVEAAARRIARSAGGQAFELSEEFATWRVTGRGGAWKLDLAALRGAGIDADLRLRDLTINAIAAPLGDGPLLDPCGGVEDLRAGLLRATSERSFADDPLRILRAARLAAAFELDPEAGTVALARAAAVRIEAVAGERQFAELGGIVSGPDPLRAIELLDRLGATAVVLPELDRLRGVGQSANHHLDAYEHTIEVLRQILALEADLERYAGPVAADVAASIGRPLGDGLTHRDGLRFAALLHDVGKPDTRTERDGFVGFRGHDRVGAEINLALCRRLRTSRRFAAHLAQLTRDHLVLGFMVGERPVPPRRVWDYLQRTAPESVDTTLLTIADRLSARGGGFSEEAISAHLELAQEMLVDAIELERVGRPAALLRGDEIAAEVGIEPGPRLGEAVRELEAASYAGEVGDREAAVAHLRAWAAAR